MMKLFNIILLVFLVHGIKAQQTYSTIADGNWSSNSTWKNGQVPSSLINNDRKVVITHKVSYDRSNDLEIREGSLSIYEGELNFPTTGTGSGRSLRIRNEGKLMITKGKLILPIFTAGNSNCSGNLINEGGDMEMHSSVVEVAQNWQSEDGAVNILVSSCIRVGENYQNDYSYEIMDRTCIEIGLQGSGNFDNDKGDIRMGGSSILLRGSSGNFKNKNYGSKIRKYGNAQIALLNLDVPGDLENNGIWDAPVEKYCVGQDIQGSRAGDIDFTMAESCTDANAYNCNCAPSNTLTNGASGAQFNYIKGDCLNEICSYEVDYFFGTITTAANSMWPDVNGANYGLFSVGGKHYTEAEARAIYNTPDPNGVMPHSKRAFLQVAALRLSKTDYIYFPQVATAVTTIDAWLATCQKLSPTNLPTNNLPANAAANLIENWIGQHLCPDRR